MHFLLSCLGAFYGAYILFGFVYEQLQQKQSVRTHIAPLTLIADTNKQTTIQTPSKHNFIEATNPQTKKCGYESITKEFSHVKLTVVGHPPEWLHGTLFFNGPCQFEINNIPFPSWFDGFAMIHKLTFKQQQAFYSNKFVQSTYYQHALKTGKLPESVQEKSDSWFSRMSSFLSNKPVYDNTNLAVFKVGPHIVAATETPQAFIINPHTLKTEKIITYDDNLEGHVCTPHPLYDPKDSTLYNILTQYGTTSYYHIFKQPPEQMQRTLISSIKVDYPAYMHSFAMTDQYIVLTEIPFTVRAFDLACSTKPFLKNFSWNAQQPTIFMIIDRKSGNCIKRIATNAFFAFHHVNAYQENDQLIVDIITYPDSTIINSAQLNYLRTHTCAKPGTLTRYTIDLTQNNASSQKIIETQLESPCINKSYIGKKHHYVYAVDAHDYALLKINTQTGTQKVWQKNGLYFNEPIFVAKPGSTQEDEGAILSITLDTESKKSFVLILDAQSFTELARMHLPHHIPFGFHGNFYPDHYLK